MTGATDLLLPHGWTLATLDDVLAAPLANGKSVPDAQNPSIAFPVLRLTSLKNGRIDLTERKLGDWSASDPDPFLVQPGDFLVSRGNGSKSLVGRGGLVTANPDPVAYPDTLIRVRADQSVLSSKFLAAIWNSSILRRQIETAARTTAGIYKINQQDMRSFAFPVPPLNEQHRIVAAIETQFTRLDAAVAALERSRANLKRYRAAVLRAACEGRLIPTEAELAHSQGTTYEDAGAFVAGRPSQRDSKASLADRGLTSRSRAVPEGWVWSDLASLKSFSLYGPRFSSDDYAPEGRLVLRTSDISPAGRVNVATAPKLNLSDAEFQKFRLEKGDLLVTRTGSLGTLAVFDDAVEAIPGAYLIQFRLRAPIITSWYVFYFLKSPSGQSQLLGGGAGVGRPNLNAPAIESIPIPLPPLAEQHRIVAEVERRLSVVEDMEKTLAANLKRAERLRQAILARAFAGKLVPQDPTDEPASALLERIREERSASSATPTRRQTRKARAKSQTLPLFDAPPADGS